MPVPRCPSASVPVAAATDQSVIIYGVLWCCLKSELHYVDLGVQLSYNKAMQWRLDFNG